MPTGSISLSGITDEQLVKAIQIKEKSNNKLNFSQMGSPSQVLVGGQPVSGYNNVTMNFTDAEGAKFAGQVLDMLGT
jgi:hypothetical protein